MSSVLSKCQICFKSHLKVGRPGCEITAKPKEVICYHAVSQDE